MRSKILPILVALEALYEHTRKIVILLHPYDSKTNIIHLPSEVDEELKMLLRTGNKVEAVKRVAQLTGAQLVPRLGGQLCGVSVEGIAGWVARLTNDQSVVMHQVILVRLGDQDNERKHENALCILLNEIDKRHRARYNFCNVRGLVLFVILIGKWRKQVELLTVKDNGNPFLASAESVNVSRFFISCRFMHQDRRKLGEEACQVYSKRASDDKPVPLRYSSEGKGGEKSDDSNFAS